MGFRITWGTWLTYFWSPSPEIELEDWKSAFYYVPQATWAWCSPQTCTLALHTCLQVQVWFWWGNIRFESLQVPPNFVTSQLIDLSCSDLQSGDDDVGWSASLTGYLLGSVWAARKSSHNVRKTRIGSSDQLTFSRISRSEKFRTGFLYPENSGGHCLR